MRRCHYLFFSLEIQQPVMNKSWIKYWKRSLCDSMRANVDLSKSEHFEIENFDFTCSELLDLDEVNKLIDIEEIKLNESRGITNSESDDWCEIECVNVIISPFKVAPIPEGLVYLEDKINKFPFWFSAILNRNGVLSMPDEGFPIFPRKYLTPNANGSAEFIFTSVEKVDVAATIGKESICNYKEYIEYVKAVFNKATDGQGISTYECEGYEIIRNGIVLLPKDEINAAYSIVSLYNKIIVRDEEEASLNLLESIVNVDDVGGALPLNSAQFVEANPLHLGQMGSSFSLSLSQRKSLYTFLNSKSKVFAVNGPPGTGKTTLLQSIVANEVVRSAIEGGDAPIILACSTNNQAVTNIIDSFSKSETKDDDLYHRWLPGVKGYATYLPSSGMSDIALKGVNYNKGKKDKSGLFGIIENDKYLNDAKEYFVEKCENHFDAVDLTVGSAIIKLQHELQKVQTILCEASQRWAEYIDSEQGFVNNCTNDENRGNYFSGDLLDDSALEGAIEKLENNEKEIIGYFRNEPFLRRLFCVLGINSALKSRNSEIRIILRESLIKEHRGAKSIKNDILHLIDDKIEYIRQVKKSVMYWKTWKENNAIEGNPPRSDEEYSDFELSKSAKSNYFFNELDVALRCKAFHLAVHYWEGRWLVKLEEDLMDRDLFRGYGEKGVKNRWRRQAMITPCFVSTFFMAPKFFCAFKYIGKNDGGACRYDERYLFDFIDILIVDEAGQVAPEIGIATFALAKKAVVVGDIKQIEPVWNITPKIDVGNLKKEGLVSTYDISICDLVPNSKGFLASSGSIMKMAQNACEFKETKLNEKGVLLVEHRRCYDEIIRYCNVLAYEGQLKALRGKAVNTLFPPMYCIHVDGNSKQKNGSRYNLNEVEAIVSWLNRNRGKIEAKYNGKIEDIVGIITPFAEQKRQLQSALRSNGFVISGMKVGTVHALQGAERSVILLSMVYGKDDGVSTMFFDAGNKPNMLNVAVSRAKDNFIVFANTGILDKGAKTPSGILARYLNYDDNAVNIK